MTQQKDHSSKNGLDSRLGTPMKKAEGFCCDNKRSEHEHLYAYREDVAMNNYNNSDGEKDRS